MDKRNRIIRVLKICEECYINLVYYRAGWKDRSTTIFNSFNLHGQVIAKTNSNFLDMCVIEWCKLFVLSGDKYHWKKVVVDEAEFINKLRNHLGLNRKEFNEFVGEIRKYRNNYLAHLGDPDDLNYPTLNTVKHSTSFLYDYFKKYQGENLA